MSPPERCPVPTSATTPTYKLIRDHVQEWGLLLGEKLTGAEQGIPPLDIRVLKPMGPSVLSSYSPREADSGAPTPPPAAPLRDPHRGPVTTWPAPARLADPSLLSQEQVKPPSLTQGSLLPRTKCPPADLPSDHLLLWCQVAKQLRGSPPGRVRRAHPQDIRHLGGIWRLGKWSPRPLEAPGHATISRTIPVSLGGNYSKECRLPAPGGLRHAPGSTVDWGQHRHHHGAGRGSLGGPLGRGLGVPTPRGCPRSGRF